MKSDYLGKVILYRGIGHTAQELRSLIEERYSMADLVVIDSGPGATSDQKATIDAADVVVVVQDGSDGAVEGSQVLTDMVENELRKECVEVVNRSDAFPEIPNLWGMLKVGKVPRELRDAASEILAVVEGAARPVVGVGGGKGGVGKTTVAACIALTACALGMKVLVIDMDNQVGCISRLISGKVMGKGERAGWVGGAPDKRPPRKRIG
jgi:cellulose biosynthesis protein BcsQ